MQSAATLLFLTGTMTMAYARSNEFEVATVKPNKSVSGATLVPGLRNGTLSARNASPKVLIRAAYGVSNLQIVGLYVANDVSASSCSFGAIVSMV